MNKCSAVYRWSCLNCARSITNDRLENASVCKSCLPNPILEPRSDAMTEHRRQLADTLARAKKLYPSGMLAQLVQIDSQVGNFSQMFFKSVKNPPLSIQLTWARRIIENRSFAIIAPTGVGKSTFAIVMALYQALRESKRTLIIVPTVTLADQLCNQTIQYLQDLDPGSPSTTIVSALHSRVSPARRQELRERAMHGQIRVLMVTGAFLRQEGNIDFLRHWAPDLLFVDDVDAVLKGGKLARALLRVTGVDEEALKKVRQVYQLQRRLMMAKNDNRVRSLHLRLQKLRQALRETTRGRVLVVSTATGQAFRQQTRVFREFFGFEVGGRTGVVRNITDLAWTGKEDDLLTTLVQVLPTLGTGGLVFVPHDKGFTYAQAIAEIISQHTSLQVRAIERGRVNDLQAFADGRLDILVGVASPYGVLVRGIDLPERIRYALFVHAPRHRLPLNWNAHKPGDSIRLLSVLVDVAPADLQERLRLTYLRLRRATKRFPTLWKLESLESLPEDTAIRRDFNAAKQLVQTYLQLPDALERLHQHPYLDITQHENDWFIHIPDWKTYLQASGRTSRLYAGGVTKGLSVVLETRPRILTALERRLRMILDGFEFAPLEQATMERILMEIDKDRERLRYLQQPTKQLHTQHYDPVQTALLIVESPNKARTIARFFGVPSTHEVNGVRVYEVSTGHMTLTIAASGGHICDLIVDEASEEKEKYGFERVLYGVGKAGDQFVPVYTSIKRCLRCGYQFTDEQGACPVCGASTIRDTHDMVKALRQLAVEHQLVFIGTDPDTEGEKIAYDLLLLLRPVHGNIRRIEFHEVTRSAIEGALSHSRDVDKRLVAAQIVRRIDDRWIGFALSREVTRALGEKERHRRPRFSAGRVQTPVLGWIIQRYEEHQRSKQLHLILDLPFNEFRLQLRIPLIAIRKQIESGSKVRVLAALTGREEEVVRPFPPYSTDSLLYDASRHLQLSASRTMQLAQNLFEWGLITYHRTDSVHVSQAGIQIARRYLQEYEDGKFAHLFTPRTWGEVGTHEAIRPTRPADINALERFLTEGLLELPGWTTGHARVYDLIFRRFIASQMAPARVYRETIEVTLSIEDENIWQGDFARFAKPGEASFLDVYPYMLNVYPVLLSDKWTATQTIEVTDAMLQVMATIPLWTAGEIVRRMKERHIGRPSTYHHILDTLIRRGYIHTISGARLVPTTRGQNVYRYLASKYSPLVSEEATRELEALMEQVAQGQAECEFTVKQIYKSLCEANLIQ